MIRSSSARCRLSSTVPSPAMKMPCMPLACSSQAACRSQKHQAWVARCVARCHRERAQRAVVRAQRRRTSEMADWLLSCAQGEAAEVRVATETPRGPVVQSLMERDFAVHSINPKQLDRLCDRFSSAGAKNDRRDAQVLSFRPCEPAGLQERRTPTCLRGNPGVHW